MSKAVQGIVANASMDLHHELGKLRKETAAGLGSARLRMRHSLGMHALRMDDLNKRLSSLRNNMEVKQSLDRLVDAVVVQALERRAVDKEALMKAQHAELSSAVLTMIDEARRETARMCDAMTIRSDACTHRLTALEHAGIATAATVDGNHHSILANMERERRSNLAARKGLRQLALQVSGKAGELYEHLAVQMEVCRLSAQTAEGSLWQHLRSVENRVLADKAHFQCEFRRFNDYIDDNRNASARLRDSVDEVCAMSKLESCGQVRLWQRGVQCAREWRTDGDQRDSIAAGLCGDTKIIDSRKCDSKHFIYHRRPQRAVFPPYG